MKCRRGTVVLLGIVLVSACSSEAARSTSTETTVPVTQAGPAASTVVVVTSAETSDARAQLLAAAARHRVFVENSFGGGNPFDRIDVIDQLGSADGGFVRHTDAALRLTGLEKDAIVAGLAPLRVEFVPTQTRVDEGAVLVGQLSLSDPTVTDNGAEITTGIVCGGLCGAGGSQRFGFVDGAWQFIELIGAQWIS